MHEGFTGFYPMPGTQDALQGVSDLTRGTCLLVYGILPHARDTKHYQVIWLSEVPHPHKKGKKPEKNFGMP